MKPRATRTGLFAWALYDWANSAFPTVIITFVFSAYFTRRVAPDEALGTAQWGAMLGLAGLLVAVTGPVLGAIADQTGRRKPWIAGFTAVAVISTALLWFVRPDPGWTGLALGAVGVALVAAESAGIFYNAMLPQLAPPDRLGRWSGWGWALGYAGGLSCLVVALVAFVGRAGPANVRATFLLVAGWFAVFALPLLVFTPDAPSGQRLGPATGAGLRQLRDSVRQVRRYTPIVRFLIARMVYADGLATLFAFGGVYAAGTLAMTEREILQFGIALNVTAGLGAFGFAQVDDRLGSRRTILIALVGLILPLSAILLVETRWAFWSLGLGLGIFVGPVQAASRSYLARLAPANVRAQMFGLYALAGKATAFVGPLLVGGLTHWSGRPRIGMIAIVGLLALGWGLMLTVRDDRDPAPANCS